MTAPEIGLLISGTYKLCTLIVGLSIIWMGYRLFRVGVFEKVADMKAAWGEKGLEIKQAAPGIYFALFGTVILSICVYRGVDIHIEEGRTRIYGDPAPRIAETAPSVPPGKDSNTETPKEGSSAIGVGGRSITITTTK